ncbi:TetR/AcrR family transcriptional regulator [Novosphingobium kunmingense]|uniref:TetR/AcrR family transcriptional regulator n=1 Tax=Novosphingobium kunmingense TaxID=1211806 RepID=UPI0012FD89F2|nr:TetR/AcrR family transcriptional regulator [Novosphingobium kunmingense]
MPRPSVPTRRADILEAARAVFSQRGYAGTRMDDVAKAIGLSKAALYLQFESKDALFQALVTDVIDRTLPDMVPADFADVPAPALLEGFVHVAAQRMTSPEVAFVPRIIIGEGSNFPDLARFYHDNVVDRGLGMVEAIIRHGVGRGEFICEDPAMACRSVIGALLLNAVWRMVFEPVGAEPVDPAAMARAHTRLLLDGLLVRKDAA